MSNTEEEQSLIEMETYDMLDNMESEKNNDMLENMEPKKDTKKISIEQSCKDKANKILLNIIGASFAICFIIFIILSIYLLLEGELDVYKGHVENIVNATVTTYDQGDCKDGNVYVVASVSDKTFYYTTCNVNNYCMDANTIQDQFSIDKSVNVYFSGTGRGCMVVEKYDDAITLYHYIQNVWFAIILYIFISIMTLCIIDYNQQ
jgi:hypothetical protein